jgi:shikimate kinase
MFKNIILTGFMGVGKTSVGTQLARDLGFTFVDVDALIEADQNMSITSIFSKFGEPYFREVETKMIEQVMTHEGQVVSTGGGAVIRDRNREAFNKGGFVVCLTASPDIIYERIKEETHRPLLQTPDPRAKIKDLLDSRAKFYALADACIDTSEKSVADVITAIKESLRYRDRHEPGQNR